MSEKAPSQIDKDLATIIDRIVKTNSNLGFRGKLLEQKKDSGTAAEIAYECIKPFFPPPILKSPLQEKVNFAPLNKREITPKNVKAFTEFTFNKFKEDHEYSKFLQNVNIDEFKEMYKNILLAVPKNLDVITRKQQSPKK